MSANNWGKHSDSEETRDILEELRMKERAPQTRIHYMNQVETETLFEFRDRAKQAKENVVIVLEEVSRRISSRWRRKADEVEPELSYSGILSHNNRRKQNRPRADFHYTKFEPPENIGRLSSEVIADWERKIHITPEIKRMYQPKSIGKLSKSQTEFLQILFQKQFPVEFTENLLDSDSCSSEDSFLL